MSYLYHATISQPISPQPKRRPPDLLSRTVGRELTVSGKVRSEHKDAISSSLQIKGPKQADALQFVEVRTLRQQIMALPEGLREDARRTHSLTQNNQQKHLQDFQCTTLIKIEQILKDNIHARKEDVRKYRIGGHDKGTYGEKSLQCLHIHGFDKNSWQNGSFAWNPCNSCPKHSFRQR